MGHGNPDSNLETPCITNVTPVDSSAGGIILPYTTFRTISFPCFLSHSFPDLHISELCVEAHG
jgi:hypothetical protein